MTSPLPISDQIFDRLSVRDHRERAAAGFAGHDFLLRESARRLIERLNDIRRHFPVALEVGCHSGLLREELGPEGGIETLIQCDLSPAMAAAARRHNPLTFAGDEEWLALREDSIDLVLSNLSLHWVNDLPGALIQINRALKPDGLFHAVLLGGDTLFELRRAMMEAEIEVDGGLSPRISPMTQPSDVGALLQRSGFALPVVDSESVTVTYSHPLALMQELRGMGETNATRERRRQPLRRGTLLRAAERYHELFAQGDGRVPATFELIFAHGWAPAETQPRPLPPGSAQRRLADALETVEVSTGVKAAPR